MAGNVYGGPVWWEGLTAEGQYVLTHCQTWFEARERGILDPKCVGPVIHTDDLNLTDEDREAIKKAYPQ